MGKTKSYTGIIRALGIPRLLLAACITVTYWRRPTLQANYPMSAPTTTETSHTAPATAANSGVAYMAPVTQNHHHHHYYAPAPWSLFAPDHVGLLAAGAADAASMYSAVSASTPTAHALRIVCPRAADVKVQFALQRADEDAPVALTASSLVGGECALWCCADALPSGESFDITVLLRPRKVAVVYAHAPTPMLWQDVRQQLDSRTSPATQSLATAKAGALPTAAVAADAPITNDEENAPALRQGSTRQIQDRRSDAPATPPEGDCAQPPTIAKNATGTLARTPAAANKRIARRAFKSTSSARAPKPPLGKTIPAGIDYAKVLSMRNRHENPCDSWLCSKKRNSGCQFGRCLGDCLLYQAKHGLTCSHSKHAPSNASKRNPGSCATATHKSHDGQNTDNKEDEDEEEEKEDETATATKWQKTGGSEETTVEHDRSSGSHKARHTKDTDTENNMDEDAGERKDARQHSPRKRSFPTSPLPRASDRDGRSDTDDCALDPSAVEKTWRASFSDGGCQDALSDSSTSCSDYPTPAKRQRFYSKRKIIAETTDDENKTAV